MYYDPIVFRAFVYIIPIQDNSTLNPNEHKKYTISKYQKASRRYWLSDIDFNDNSNLWQQINREKLNDFVNTTE